MNQDEEIIKELNAYKNESYGSLAEGYYIRQVKYIFKEFSLFNESVHIMLPSVAKDMPEDLKKIKYPNEQRPQIIKSCLDEGIDFSFYVLHAQSWKYGISLFCRQ